MSRDSSTVPLHPLHGFPRVQSLQKAAPSEKDQRHSRGQEKSKGFDGYLRFLRGHLPPIGTRATGLANEENGTKRRRLMNSLHERWPDAVVSAISQMIEGHSPIAFQRDKGPTASSVVPFSRPERAGDARRSRIPTRDLPRASRDTCGEKHASAVLNQSPWCCADAV